MKAQGTSDLAFLGRNVPRPRELFAELEPGAAIHGFTDGKWSLHDALLAISELTGPSDLVCSTWTATIADTRAVHYSLSQCAYTSARFLFDQSFITREPKVLSILIELFGESALRFWRSHAKFCLMTGGAFDVLYLTSANLGKNKRMENFSLFAGGTLPAEYGAMVRDVWARQGDGEALDSPKRADIKQTRQLVREGNGDLFDASPIDTEEEVASMLATLESM